jgi:hypothetical protein
MQIYCLAGTLTAPFLCALADGRTDSQRTGTFPPPVLPNVMLLFALGLLLVRYLRIPFDILPETPEVLIFPVGAYPSARITGKMSAVWIV